MLYRTHHHTFLFTFNPFSNSSSSLPPHSSSSSSSRFQVMDCAAQAALKGGFVAEPEASAALGDEFWGVNAGSGNCGGTGDDFFVDELLDFSSGYAEAEGSQLPAEEPEEKESDGEKNCPLSQEKVAASGNGVASVKFDFGPLCCGEFGGPAEGLESLEWLSHFVEDSFPDYSLTVKLPHAPPEYLSKPAAINVPEQRCFTAAVQTKARTKRARSGVRVWPVLSPSTTESSTSSSSSTHSTASLSPTNPLPFQCQTVESLLGKSLALKQKKKPAIIAAGLAVQPRRCSHCGVTKTPQWRAGPLGSKTLCNACGVRFKSGRLLPEYRPACSPTFSSEVHSNNHRKVLEMRRKKESEVETAGLGPPVRSF